MLGCVGYNFFNFIAISSLFSSLLKNDSPSGWEGCLALLLLSIFLFFSQFQGLLHPFFFALQKKLKNCSSSLVFWTSEFHFACLLLQFLLKWKLPRQRSCKQFLKVSTQSFLVVQNYILSAELFKGIWLEPFTALWFGPTFPIGFRDLKVTCDIYSCFPRCFSKFKAAVCPGI